METAVTASKISTAVGTFIVGTLLIVELLGMVENRKKLQISTASTRWRFSLCVASWFAFAVFLADGALVWKTWFGKWVVSVDGFNTD
jgi:hypothetical protein